MKEMNQNASQAIIQANRNLHGNDPNVVDFHGLTVAEAKIYAADVLNARSASSNTNRKIKIIAGVGNHSKGEKPKLYPMLYQFCLKQGWKVRFGGPGWFWAFS